MYRSITLLVITTVIAFFLLQPVTGNAASQVGSILSLKGQVVVRTTAGNYKTPYLAMGLYEGDSITVYPNSHCVVSFYCDGHMEYITCNWGTYFIAEMGSTTLSKIYGIGSIARIDQSGSISVAGTTQVSQKIGGSIQRVKIPPVLIRVEASSTTTPTFKWIPEDNVESYTFKLSNGYEKEVTGGELLYSGEELKRGETYTWTVRPKGSANDAEPAKIYIISDEESEAINLLKKQVENQVSQHMSDNTPYKFMGNYLFDISLYEEALDYYKKAQKIKPDDKELADIIKTLDTFLKTGELPK